MGWDNKDGKHFGLVCETHDRYLGRKNLVKAGMTIQETILFEHYLAQTVDNTNPVDWPVWLELRNYRAPVPSTKLLGLSPKLQNILRRYNVTTVVQLASMSDHELLRMRTMGKKTLQEVHEYLERHVSGQTNIL